MTAKPTERQLKALRDIDTLSGETSGFYNQGDCEECVDKGWLEPSGKDFALTSLGRQILKNAGR